LSIPTRALGTSVDGQIYEQEFNRHIQHGAGAIVYTHPLVESEINSLPFRNDTFGIAMNQDVSFGGTPELILDGGSGGSEWTGVINTGNWNLSDAGKAHIQDANNNDNVTYSDAGSIDMNNYTAISGKVTLEQYQPAKHKIEISFGVGNFVNLDDYIDTGDSSEQNFIITKADLGIGSFTVDEMTITMKKNGGGAKSRVDFDDIQIEQTGSPITFEAAAESGKTVIVSSIRFVMSAAYASALTDATMPNLSHTKLLSVDALTNGIVFKRVRRSVTTFQTNIKDLGGFLSVGGVISDTISDGTNTMLSFDITFPQPISLEGLGTESDNYISITINDDLTGLTQFTAFARGSVEL